MMMFSLWLLPCVSSFPWCILSVGECRRCLSPSGQPEYLITCIWPDCQHTCHPSAHHPSSTAPPTASTSRPVASIACPALPDSAILQYPSTFVIWSPTLTPSIHTSVLAVKPHIGLQATESFWAPLLRENFCNSTSLRFNYFAFCQFHLGSLIFALRTGCLEMCQIPL